MFSDESPPHAGADPCPCTPRPPSRLIGRESAGGDPSLADEGLCASQPNYNPPDVCNQSDLLLLNVCSIDSTASIYHVTSIRSDSDFGSMQPDPGLGLTPSIENLPGPTDPRFAAAACTHHSTQITHTSHKISTSKQLAQRCHHDVIRVVTRLTAAAAFGAKGRCGMSDPMPETEAVIACGGFCGRCAPSSPDLGPSFPLPAASPFAAIRTNVR